MKVDRLRLYTIHVVKKRGIVTADFREKSRKSLSLGIFHVYHRPVLDARLHDCKRSCTFGIVVWVGDYTSMMTQRPRPHGPYVRWNLRPMNWNVPLRLCPAEGQAIVKLPRVV